MMGAVHVGVVGEARKTACISEDEIGGGRRTALEEGGPQPATCSPPPDSPTADSTEAPQNGKLRRLGLRCGPGDGSGGGRRKAITRPLIGPMHAQTLCNLDPRTLMDNPLRTLMALLSGQDSILEGPPPSSLFCPVSSTTGSGESRGTKAWRRGISLAPAIKGLGRSTAPLDFDSVGISSDPDKLETRHPTLATPFLPLQDGSPRAGHALASAAEQPLRHSAIGTLTAPSNSLTSWRHAFLALAEERRRTR
jgi:hypothetical protein